MSISSLRWRTLSFLSTLLIATSAQAQFYSLETDDLRLVYYGQAQEYLVPHVARTFQNALKFHQDLYDFTPSERVTVMMHDFTDVGNAGADVLPKNHITVGIAPYNFVYETVPSNERMNSTFNHELVHIVANDMSTGADRFFRGLFGGKVATTSENPLSILYSYMTAPRRYAPRWYHEGIAVFMETWMAGGLGRSLGAYDEMVFRTVHLEGARIYDPVGLESEGTQIDFQAGVNSYLYGTRFMNYLALEYGPESLVEWTARAPGSRGYFGSQFRKVYGVSLARSWSQWIESEHDFQEANLETIRSRPITPYREISGRSLGSVSRAFLDEKNGSIYAAINYPGQVPHIASISLKTGAVKKLLDVKGAALYYVTSLVYDPESRSIFYTTDNNDWRDLRVYEVDTGTSRTLMKDARVGDLAFNPVDRSLWGVRHFNGVSTIVRIPAPYERWSQVYSWPYSRDVYDIDISPDGKWLAGALAQINGDQYLIQMSVDSLLGGSTDYETLFDFGNSNPANFVYAPDGRSLYGSSYYSGVSNIYRYDVDSTRMEIFSNAESGLFRPVYLSPDSLLVFRFTSRGFVPALIPNETAQGVRAIRLQGQDIVERHPVVRDWVVASPAFVEIDSLTTYSGTYSGLKNLSLVSVYPIVEGYQDVASFGLRAAVSSPIGLHAFDATVSYSPSTSIAGVERIHGRARYGYGNWTISASHNGADFYDLFGPTKTSRKGSSLALNYKKTLIFDRPKTMDYSVSVAGYTGLRRLPEYQNITTSFSQLLSGSFVLNYRNMRSSLGAVDREKGVSWQIAGSSNLVSGKLFPRIYGAYDIGRPLPIGHSSIWLRLSAGQSFGRRIEPFANFYFGGFGNNWVDHRTEKRYREYYSFPGIELNAAGGTNFGRVMAEWNLPPLRFRSLGGPSLFLQWARLSVFSTGLMTNLDDTTLRRTLVNVGGQLDFRITSMSYLSSMLSVGYGVSFEEGEDPQTEFMLSFKIL